MKTEPVGGCRIVRLVKCYCLDDANVLVSSDCDEMVFTGLVACIFHLIL